MRLLRSPRSMMSGAYTAVLLVALLPAVIIQVLVWLEPLAWLINTAIVLFVIWLPVRWWWRRSPMRGRQLVGALLSRLRGDR